MKPMVMAALEKKTVQQAIEALGDRVNALGVSEPVIQEYGLGANQVLVELPGVENESDIEKDHPGHQPAGDSRRGRRSLQGRAGGGRQPGRQHSGRG
jgi:hypothetical protein